MQILAKGFELIIFDGDGVLVDSEPIIPRRPRSILHARDRLPKDRHFGCRVKGGLQVNPKITAIP